MNYGTLKLKQDTHFRSELREFSLPVMKDTQGANDQKRFVRAFPEVGVEGNGLQRLNIGTRFIRTLMSTRK